MNWIELSAGDYEIRESSRKVSNCQLEIDCQCVDRRPDLSPIRC